MPGDRDSPDQGILTQPRRCAVVFDFDGTLADTLRLAVEVLNEVAPEFGFEPVDDATVESLRGVSAREAIAKLGIRPRHLAKLHVRVRRGIRARLGEIVPFPGVPEVIEKLASSGATLGVLTSNSAENVEAFFSRIGIRQHFSFIVGASSLFGKARHLRRLLGNQLAGVAPDRVTYVGDELRDIEAAQKAAVRAGAVTWGANTRELLTAHAPDFVFESPAELAALVR
jgi:phosphoglycolate phosphatase